MLGRGTLQNAKLKAFLFTDIEGSTKLWEKNPEAMSQYLDHHDEIIGRVCQQFAGQHVLDQGEGDSHFCVFENSVSAILAANQMQRELSAVGWPEDCQIKVRMGIHTGEARQRAFNYYGSSVIRAARIRACAHGGQVIISKSSYELAKEELRDQVDFTFLGSHRLKDLLEPELIYQVDAFGCAKRFPSLRSLDRIAHNLPIQLSSFVGRQSDIDAIEALVTRKRLVTITGSGGVGKTRLSVQVGAEIADLYERGVWFIDLTTDRSHLDAEKRIVETLSAGQGPSTISEVARAIGSEEILVILDNCEHLANELSPILQELTRSCAGLHIIATSRRVFHLAGEQVYRVPSLTFPSVDEDEDLEKAREYEAVRLFLERAEEVDPNFSPTGADLRDIGAICRQLDGLPLAIELAAAKTRILSVAELRTRLREKFAVLAASPGQITPRHQTIRTAIEHSYQLLNDNDRKAFDTLSIFEGSWSVEAAERVLKSIGIPDPLTTIQDLFDYSLLIRESGSLSNRYRFFETVREFAKDVGQVAPDAVDAYCVYYAEAAKALDTMYRDGGAADANLRARADHNNFLAALRLHLERDDWHGAAQLAYHLRELWIFDSRIAEGASIFAELAASRPADDSLVAKILNVAGVFAWIHGDLETARTYLSSSLEVWVNLGDESQIGNVHNNLGLLASGRGDYEVAAQHFQRSLTTARAAGDRPAAAKSLANIGAALLDNSDYPAARSSFEEAWQELGQVRDEMTTGTLLANIAFAAVCADDADAPEKLAEAIEYELCHERVGLAYRLLLVSAQAALDRKDRQFSRSLLHAAVLAHEESQSPWRTNERLLLEHLDRALGERLPKTAARHGIRECLEQTLVMLRS